MCRIHYKYKNDLKILRKIHDYISDFGHRYLITSPRCWQIRRQQRKNDAINASIGLICDFIKYHCNFKDAAYNQLLIHFFQKHKSIIRNLFSFKRYALTVNQTVQLQKLLSINNNKMRQLQQFIKTENGTMLMCNEQKLLDYQKERDLKSAQTLLLKLKVATKFINSESQLPIQELAIYLVDIRDAISRLCSNALNTGTYHIHDTLPSNELLTEIGWDKSDSGIAESVSVAVKAKHHGKYNSIMTTLTDHKAAENYINYMEIAKLCNKRTITNQLLKKPNCIIIGKNYVTNDGEIKSKKFAVFPMIFDPVSQQRWNMLQQEEIINTPAPQICSVSVDNGILAAIPSTRVQIKPNSDSNSMEIESKNDSARQKGKNEIDDDANDNSNENENPSDSEVEILEEKHNVSWMNEDTHELDPTLRTAVFWFQKQQLLHLDHMYSVQVPSSLDLHYQKPWTAQQQKCQDLVVEWVKCVLKGETQIVHKQTCANTSCNTADNSPNNGNSSNNNDNHNDPDCDMQQANGNDTVVTTGNGDSDAQEWVPGPHDVVSSDIEINSKRKKKRRKKKNKIVTKVIKLQTYKLSDFHFNGASNCNRMMQSEWDMCCTNASTECAQSDKLYFIQYSKLELCEQNSNLCTIHNSQTGTKLSLNALFDDDCGISYFWIQSQDLPFDYKNDDMYMLTLAIVHNDLIAGIVNCNVQPCDYEHSATHMLNIRQCMINQRCLAFENFSVRDCNILNDDTNNCVIIDVNKDRMRQLAASHADHCEDFMHNLQWWQMKLNARLQFDNKGKSMIQGHGPQSCKYPCSICNISTNELKSLPRPSSMSWSTRTESTRQHNLHLGMDNNGKVDLKKSFGVQNVSIYDVPAHAHGGTTLHNCEGMYAITMDTFRDFLCPLLGHKAQWSQLQNHLSIMQDQYEQISKLQDSLDNTDENSNDREIFHWYQEASNKLQILQTEYKQQEDQYNAMRHNVISNQLMNEFVQIMDKYNISLYYILSNSVQGVVCGRVNKARFDLVNLAKKVSETGSIIWNHLLTNLAYLYDMLKHKSCRNWTDHECATVKTAYLDWLHQHVLAVCLWRQTGSVGIKCHIFAHDIEKAIKERRSPAMEDDQRFENMNQQAHDGLKNYTRYKKLDKLKLVARKMNVIALS